VKKTRDEFLISENYQSIIMSGILKSLIAAFAGAIYFGSTVTADWIPPPCQTSVSYKITSQIPYAGAPECVPSEPFLDPDPSGGSLAAGKQFTKTVTVTGGFSETFDV
jgi:hypothetical protein